MRKKIVKEGKMKNKKVEKKQIKGQKPRVIPSPVIYPMPNVFLPEVEHAQVDAGIEIEDVVREYFSTQDQKLAEKLQAHFTYRSITTDNSDSFYQKQTFTFNCTPKEAEEFLKGGKQ